ncbi:ABC transporter ATP-binding protein [Actinomyces capricornis]|uniref:ABC transporter domain-containing protein n=1 Tax=Actinomyces capricornis TaxID=2755559 RepID=A0ABN6K699_9ACTO|nr:dipeptide/oligopeptide/nickel ABC transporter ATP-binding protein [Actinomyces capricornis]BDA63896.1 hypothetical protein MANAM107_07300 [Actinomyces capricornis]
MSGLAVRGLTRSYRAAGGYHRVLRGLDLALAPGQSAALLGRSGCGKTTLLRALLLMDRPGPEDGGQILLEGREVRRGSARRMRPYRRAVQYVPQDAAASLDPRRRVLDQVTTPLRTLGVAGGRAEHEERAAALLQGLGVAEHLWGSRPHEISGGQAQRVAIARALAPRPSYLLLDEPVSGLDPALRRQVLELLAGLGGRGSGTEPATGRTAAQAAGPSSGERAGREPPEGGDDDAAAPAEGRAPAPALLVVSHDLAAVARICQRCLVMDDGALVEDAPMERILTSPSHRATRALRDAVPQMPAIGA